MERNTVPKSNSNNEHSQKENKMHNSSNTKSINKDQKSQMTDNQTSSQKQKYKGIKKILNVLFVKKWHPQPTVNATILIFGVVGIIFIILGILIGIFNSTIVETELANYQESSNCEIINSNDPNDKHCLYKFTIADEDMQPPIYVFYTLDNFYQNHRRYMKSKSTSQLSGTVINSSSAKDSCDPIIKNKDIKKGLTSYLTGQALNDDDIASPCGLIAKSFFQDSFELYTDRGMTNRININEKGIAWPEDRNKKYKRPSSKAEQDKQWVDPENEHFIVWMRTSGLPNFRKLWGKIDKKLKQGQDYYMKINSLYDVKSFKGKKGIVLSTAGPLGGKNQFLFASFLVVGIFCIIIAFVFVFKKKLTNNAFGEARQNEPLVRNSQ